MDESTSTNDYDDELIQHCTKTQELFHDSSDDDEEFDEDDCTNGEFGSNYLLYGLRQGMINIRKNTRKEIGKCSSEFIRDELRDRIESSTLGLIREEKKYLETSRIVASIVDDYCDDDEPDGHYSTELSNHIDDKPKPGLPGPNELILAQNKMSELFDIRMKTFSESLTSHDLSSHPQYKALQREIALGQEDFDRGQYNMVDCSNECGGGDGNGIIVNNGDDDGIIYEEEDLYEDETILPSKDPLTKSYLSDPCRNKYCNHVFDKPSINQYIKNHPGASCPFPKCDNKRPLHSTHFINNENMTMKIRAKNSKNYNKLIK